jgi:hypothetical protein
MHPEQASFLQQPIDSRGSDVHGRLFLRNETLVVGGDYMRIFGLDEIEIKHDKNSYLFDKNLVAI